MHQNTPAMRRCTVQRFRGEFCDVATAEDMPFPICAHHALKLYKRLSQMADGDLEALVPTRTAQSPSGRRERTQQSVAIRTYLAGRSAVYAVRFPDGVVKIGCSKNLPQRLTAYWAAGGELVGFQVGEYADEQALHASLKPHLTRGREWYHPAPEVLAVVNGMRESFNLPPIAA